MPVVFDVGANDGNSCFHLCRDPANIVYAFEPTPVLLERLEGFSRMVSNYHVVPCAVSNVAGTAQFNIVDGDDWVSPDGKESGCGGANSLCMIREHEKLRLGKTIDVSVITLEDFIEKENIQEIEYLHCDVQGKDLEVLMGLGKHKDKVKRGVIEMCRTKNHFLYTNQVYDAADAVRWLYENDFFIDKIESNNHLVSEVNIFFHRINDSDRVDPPFKPLFL